MRHLLVLFVMFSAGCLRNTTFKCEESTECGAGGQCEADGLCSVVASSCPSGRAYGPNSGSRSGDCVGGDGMDGGKEMTGGEMPGGEPNPMGCRADYMALPNSGPRGHRYLAVATNATWPQQRDFCVANMGFLAFPDGTTLANAQLELSAIVTFGGTNLWVGVNDIGGTGQEGKYKTSLNMNVSTITAMLITESGNSNNEDCLAGTATTMNDEDCATTRKAVCECVP
jgi:hypothetical protein